jgi:excisionase family DNA binding protein
VTFPPSLSCPVPDPGEGLELVTISEAAHQLRVSKMTVYRLIHHGELPAIRISRTFRIHRCDLDEFLRITRYSP